MKKKITPFHKSPTKCASTTAPCVKSTEMHSQNRGPLDPLPSESNSHTDGRGDLKKEGGIAQGSVSRELRAVRRLDKRPDAEPEPSIRH